MGQRNCARWAVSVLARDQRRSSTDLPPTNQLPAHDVRARRCLQKFSSSSSSPDGKYALRHVNSYPLHDLVQPDAIANTDDQDTASQSKVATPLQLARYTAFLDDKGLPVMLGKGAFCCAWKYVDSHSGRHVAIKRVALTGLSVEQRKELANQLQAELMYQRLLYHPHIIKLLGAFVSGCHLNVVMELANKGLVLQLLEACASKTGAGMKESEARVLFQQLVSALDYLHSEGMSHRDIKFENMLLVQGPGDDKPVMKLSDFGCSTNGKAQSTSVRGTACYLSPEILHTALAVDPTASCSYNPQMADVWAAGVVLATLVTGTYPFVGMQRNAAFAQRLQAMQKPLQLPRHLSSKCRDLLQQMLAIDATQRLNLEGVKQHPWLVKGLPDDGLTMPNDILCISSKCLQNEDGMLQVLVEAIAVIDGW